MGRHEAMLPGRKVHGLQLSRAAPPAAAKWPGPPAAKLGAAKVKITLGEGWEQGNAALGHSIGDAPVEHVEKEKPGPNCGPLFEAVHGTSREWGDRACP